MRAILQRSAQINNDLPSPRKPAEYERPVWRPPAVDQAPGHHIRLGQVESADDIECPRFEPVGAVSSK
jgi:hypothetical protein